MENSSLHLSEPSSLELVQARLNHCKSLRITPGMICPPRAWSQQLALIGVIRIYHHYPPHQIGCERGGILTDLRMRIEV